MLRRRRDHLTCAEILFANSRRCVSITAAAMRSQPYTKINLPDADWFAQQSPYVTLFCLFIDLSAFTIAYERVINFVITQDARSTVAAFLERLDAFASSRASNSLPSFTT